MKGTFLRKICTIAIISAVSTSAAHALTGAEAFVEHYNAGQEFMMQNQYSSAVGEFRKALRINYMDNSARIGIINAYLARASYYANQQKDYEKAANDFRSALFYLRIYPTKEQSVQNSAPMITSAMENLKQCLHVISFDTTAASRYKKGEELRAAGNLSAAAYEFYLASQNEKYVADANIQVANLLKHLGNEKRSVEYYKRALDADPNNGNLRMTYARTLDKLGYYDEALPQYNAALSNAKGDPEILYALERIYYKKLAQTPSDAELNANFGAIKQAQGDFDEALSYYSKAEKLNPENVTTRLNVGTLFQQKKDYQKALTAYDSVLTLNPNNTQALLYKAQALDEMGDKQNSLAIYKRLLTLEPANAEARNQVNKIMKETMPPDELLVYLSKTGETSELYDFAYKMHKENNVDLAIKGYKAVIEKDSSNVNAYVNLAVCYASKEDYKNSLAVLNTALTKFPSNKLVLKTQKEVQEDAYSTGISSAISSYQNKDYRKAVSEYLAINPATKDSLLGAAASYQALDDYDNAIVYYKKAEALAPKDAEIPYYIGYLYSQKEDWANAENYLKKAIALNPESEAKSLLSNISNNNVLAILNSAIDSFDKHDYTSAIQKFNDVLSKDSKNAYAYYYRALINDEQKKTQAAISDYLNVLKYTNEFPIVNYMLAVDYDSVSNYKEAVKYFTEFISKYSTDDEYLKYAKSRLEEIKPYAS